MVEVHLLKRFLVESSVETLHLLDQCQDLCHRQRELVVRLKKILPDPNPKVDLVRTQPQFEVLLTRLWDLPADPAGIP